jgi:hypothetical protein
MKFVLLVAAVVLAFIAGSGIQLSILPPPYPELKIEASPPGYPPNGETWKITVWAWNGSLGPNWVKSSNASVTLFLETGEIRTILTGPDGEAAVEFRPEFGTVRIEASKDGFPTVAWIPASRFVSLPIATAFYAGFFALAGITVTLIRTFFKSESQLPKIVRTPGYCAGVTLVIFSFLAGRWFYKNLQTGPTWGFNAAVFGPIVFEHLFIVLGLLACFILLYEIALWTFRHRRPRHSDLEAKMVV